MKTIVDVEMELHSTTPHKFRFKAVEEDAVLGDIYIRKEAFPKGKHPKGLHVLVRG
jgi:hypothetical protein